MAKCDCDCQNITIVEGIFGEINLGSRGDSNEEGIASSTSSIYGESKTVTNKNYDEPIKIKSYTMSNAHDVEIVLITWGATIVSIKCPDKDGMLADIVLGFDDMQTYLDPMLNNYIGCILGRCANRIKDGTFKIKDSEYYLSKNDSNKHHIHGGMNGFGRRIWESYVDNNNSYVVMSLLSEDGDEGYPGSVLTTIKFRLTPKNCLEINMRAGTSKATVMNLSYGLMFNLAGHETGKDELLEHEVCLNCDRWTYSECKDPIPTGEFREVGSTIMDLRIPRFLKEVIEKVPAGKGYDHNFCVTRSTQPQLALVSRIFHPKSGRYLEVFSDQPGLQFYTGGHLPPYSLSSDTNSDNCPKSSASSSCTSCKCSCCDCESETASSQISGNMLAYLPGKCGAQYTQFGALSVQPQNYPNAINTKKFPCALLRPGQFYYHDLTYKFGIQQVILRK